MTAAEYTFRIEDFRPDTLPMGRLAEYLGDFAKLLGSPDYVHFARIEEGSTRLVAAVAQQARPQVSPRVRAAALGNGPPDAVSAWRRLNKRLTEDATCASLAMPGGEVIPFPGSPRPDQPIGPLRQPTSIQGRLVRIEGYGESVSVGIEDGSGIARRIVIDAELAKRLASHFHRFVRLSGTGRWRRTADGRWSLEQLDAEAFHPLDDEPIGDVVRRAGKMIPEGGAERAISLIRDLRRT
ncbi:hypothetical protein [Rhodovulum sp. PH10]|uniref:hypothetical protein n=1 Tax=Rhodovulum sp. PH10 TaxID=1187851 RepID=UPI00058F76EC|nr:hypothetical protein [Rhodovulum sp. PH10]